LGRPQRTDLDCAPANAQPHAPDLRRPTLPLAKRPSPGEKTYLP
jgi:hypothetical protein